MYCEKCGKELRDDVLFCTACGHKRSVIQEPVQPVQPVTPSKPSRPAKPSKPPKPPKPDNDGSGFVKGLIIGLAIIAVLALAGAGTYAYFVYFADDTAREETADTDDEGGSGSEKENSKKDKKDKKSDAKEPALEENEPLAEPATAEPALEEPAAVEAEPAKEVPMVSIEQAESVLMDVDSKLARYIWVVMMEQGGASDVRIVFDDAEKIRAAVLACETDDMVDSNFIVRGGKMVLDESAETGPNGNGYHGRLVLKRNVDSTCLELFGTEADWNAFQTSPKCQVFDAVKYSDKTGKYALQIDAEVETETDQKSQSWHITESGSGYTGEVEMFYGYWGELSSKPGYSNYIVYYELEPSEETGSGLAVTSITITRK